MGRDSTGQLSRSERLELIQGTLDMLILRVLRADKLHGQAIAQAIELTSEDALKVDHGSLYPALQRLQQQGWITAAWGVSATNRKAKFYSLTKAGRQHLTAEASRWERLTRAIALIMHPRIQE